MYVETTSSPPAAGGSSIPPQIGQLDIRVLLTAPGGGVFFFVTVRENLCNFCGDFRAPEATDLRNRKKDLPDFVGTWYLVRTSTRCGRLSVSDNFSGMYIG